MGIVSGNNIANKSDDDESSISSIITGLDQLPDVAYTMVAILGTMFALLLGLTQIQTPLKNNDKSPSSKIVNNGRWFPCPQREPSKYYYETYCACYTPIWIAAFAIIVIFELYESFDATTYNLVCGGLALPFLLQPLLLPSARMLSSPNSSSPDALRPFGKRYATKANLWLATYSFIGNYWYTHYFYSVLQAKYTMPSSRLNNVPLAMYFATHFYFSSYHVFSNLLLRKIRTSYARSISRTFLTLSTVFVLSYFTAFMETLTISSFPYYSFEDRHMAYTIGSAFYGIYFLVSFPAFAVFDEGIDHRPYDDKDDADDETRKGNEINDITLWDTFVQSCGYGMIILCLLDFVRLYLDIPLVVGVIHN